MPEGAIIGLERGIVRLVPYDPGWAVLFEEEKARLSRALGCLLYTSDAADE